MLKWPQVSACIILLLCVMNTTAQAPAEVIIARDSFGVPHIFAKTDAAAAYGLAWAHSEDDFKHIQHNLLAGKGMLGEVLGKEGVLFDFALKFLKIDSLVEARFDEDISDDFKKVIEGYARGINDYALSNKKDVLLKKAFPISAKDIIRGYTLTNSLLAGVGMALKAINDGKVEEYYSASDGGSNSMAIAPSRTEDSATYLLINSHQPLEGRFAWYEAHISSEEGWDIIGGLFPGGLTAFVGTNQFLGWAHTTNYHTFGDIYKLEVNPKNRSQYKYDDQWREFNQRKIKLRVKLSFIKLKVKRKILDTEYGPVFKKKNEYYAIRFPAYMDIRAGEQWFRMNKAKSFDEFEKAVKMEAVPLFNIVYGDRDGNIYLHSGGKIPKRDPQLDWNIPVAGTRSEYKWNEFVKYDEKPTLLNPECGYVFNCNQSPLFATGDDCQWNGEFIGLQQFVYNRGERFEELLEQHSGDFSWNDFLEIKFDKAFARDGSYMQKLGILHRLDERKYPDIADAILKLKRWDLTGEKDNEHAALVMIIHDILRKTCDCPFALLMIRKRELTEEEAVNAIRKAKNFMMKKYGTLNTPLGEIQRHIRGKITIPASGLREVPRAADAVLFSRNRGIYKVISGDGYIQVVKFSNSKVDLQTINSYGASANPSSSHYSDQMQFFQNEEFKKMTFEKNDILKKAVRVYRPDK